MIDAVKVGGGKGGGKSSEAGRWGQTGICTQRRLLFSVELIDEAGTYTGARVLTKDFKRGTLAITRPVFDTRTLSAM